MVLGGLDTPGLQGARMNNVVRKLHLVLPRVRFLGYVVGVALILLDKNPIRVGLEHGFHIRDLMPGQ